MYGGICLVLTEGAKVPSQPPGFTFLVLKLSIGGNLIEPTF